jgi:putative MATE family efflux protein
LSQSAQPQAGSAADPRRAVFTHGSIMRHVLVMSATGAAGLIAIFLVDLANLFYISLLGQQELAAAVGYASSILFFAISCCIGFTIAATAITGRAFGAKDTIAAHKNAGASMAYTFTMSLALAVLMYPLLSPSLTLLGATGETHRIALVFMQIVTPSVPILGLGMCGASLLRARGDARRAMYVTLITGFSAAAIDPLLIFGLDLGVNGAAIATVIVRVVMLLAALHGLVIVHKMLAVPDAAHLKRMLRPFMAIALPAVLTQIATPVGNAYVTGAIARFGDDAVAGWAIIGRLIPLAFAGLFALSGAVGPILAQMSGQACSNALLPPCATA